MGKHGLRRGLLHVEARLRPADGLSESVSTWGVVSGPAWTGSTGSEEQASLAERAGVGEWSGAVERTGIAEREGLAHDACNLLAAVGLYCDLMSRPGVVNTTYQHYLAEMRRLAQRSEGLIERLMPRASAEIGNAVDGDSGLVASLCGVSAGTNNLELPQDPKERRGRDEERLLRELMALEDFGEINGPVDIGDLESLRATVESAAPVSAKAGAESKAAATARVNVAALLAESREMLQVLAGPGVALEVESLLPAGVLTAISEESLLRVLVNLTVNARDAMPEGGRLRLTAQWAGDEFGGCRLSASEIENFDGNDFGHGNSIGSGSRNAVLISIQDTGVGMPAEMVAAINKSAANGVRLTGKAPETNAGAAMRNSRHHRSGRMHGLGLEIVRELVEIAGGSLQVLSAATGVKEFTGLSIGTRFEITLPLARRSKNKAVASSFALTNMAVKKAVAAKGAKSAEREMLCTVAIQAMQTNGVATREMIEQIKNDRATMAGIRRLQLVSPRASNARPRTRGQQTAQRELNQCAERGTAIC